MLHSEGLEKRQGHRVLAVFGAFRFLRVGSTLVQLHSQENEIYLTFSKSADILNFFVRVFCSLYFFAYLCYTCKKLRQVIK